jgi:hypothetical protein
VTNVNYRIRMNLGVGVEPVVADHDLALVGNARCHPGGAKPSRLAGERQQMFTVAVRAADPGEARARVAAPNTSGTIEVLGPVRGDSSVGSIPSTGTPVFRGPSRTLRPRFAVVFDGSLKYNSFMDVGGILLRAL